MRFAVAEFSSESPVLEIVPGRDSFRNQGWWGGSSAPSHTSSWGKEKTILDYFVPLAVRMGCLFVLGGLPDMGLLAFFLPLFPSEIKSFFKNTL